MLNKKSRLFYTRQLQIKFYSKNNKILIALFLLEKFLFDNFNFKEEIPISNLKQKWIYENIKNDDYENETMSFLKIIDQTKVKKKFLLLIETFSNISSDIFDKDFLTSFENFNKTFNEIIEYEIGKSFKSFYLFQLTYLAYNKGVKLDEVIKKKIDFKDKSIDFFEIVFLDIYLNSNKKKVSKNFYLFKLILKFFNK